MDADGRDDVSFPPGVAGAVRERHLVVALACPQQTQVLSDIYTRRRNRYCRCGDKSMMPVWIFQCGDELLQREEQSLGEGTASFCNLNLT